MTTPKHGLDDKTFSQLFYAEADPHSLLGSEWWQLNDWREAALMLAESTGEAEPVARWLGQASPWLGVEILQHFLAGDQTLKAIDPTTRQILLESAQPKLNEPNPIGRAQAYRVLGLFDADKRPGIGVIVKDQQATALPDLEWCEIPDGKFQFSGQVDKFGGSKQEAKELSLPTFYMAKYPVTYAQFQCFTTDPQGFTNQKWWEGLGDAQHRNQEQAVPVEPPFPYANLPRESVSWYYAIAFCRWLSHRLWAIGAQQAIPNTPQPENYNSMNPATWLIRLPTEAEWEKAARGPTGLIYPYGDDFDATKCNTVETGIGLSNAVGIFPLGASPYGVLEMSGNVWEWCLSEAIRNYKNHLAEGVDIGRNEHRVLRGGSCDYKASTARADHRDYDDALRGRGNRGSRGNRGFRVCCTSVPLVNR